MAAWAAALLGLAGLVLTTASEQEAATVQLLQSLAFGNEGLVRATDRFGYQGIACGYLEPDLVPRAQYAWAAENTCDYLVQLNTASPPTACTVASLQPGCDRPGSDMATVVLPAGSGDANAALCGQQCCATPGCSAFVYAIAPGPFMSCVEGEPCCYLKSSVPAAVNSSAEDIHCGTTQGNSPIPPPDNTPPSGMRSAVPQGGLGAGSVEMRADGTFREWTLENQSPAGSAKFHLLDNAFAALRVDTPTDSYAAALRTHPPAGVPGVAALKYSGAHPVGRLSLEDTQLGVEARLFAYSSYFVNDLRRSSKPGNYYTALVRNPAQTTLNVSLLMTLPLAFEENTARPDPTGMVVPSATTALACFYACAQSPGCLSWSHDPNQRGCVLSTTVPLNFYAGNVTSGVKSTWVPDASRPCLNLLRDPRVGGPTAGNASLCAGPGTRFTFGAANTASQVFGQFASGPGLLRGTQGPLAAVAATVTVGPGESVAIPLTLAWYFPDRDHLGENIGNHYANDFAGSAQVADAMQADALAALTNISALNAVFYNSSLPPWLQDSLINTLSHVRSAWWTRDGRWRQWEAYDCVNIDSVHNDGERHLPYIYFFPEATRNKLAAWGQYAQANGMINEQLGCGCTGPVPRLDDACGRVMSDVTSMFLMYVLELYKWGNDTETLATLWPHVVKAAEWQIAVAQAVGIPQHLVATYDILGLDRYPTATYNGVFHLMAMQAAKELAVAMGNATLAQACAAAFVRGQQALDTLLWVPNGNQSHYAAVQGVNASLMADCLYGQVLAFSAGLGELLQDPDRLEAHLLSEGILNDTPFGLRAVTGATVGGTDDTIWQGASPNWASLNLRHFGARAWPSALAQPEKSLSQVWQYRLRDQWNTAGLLSSEGLPYITSHYGFHMVQWHLVSALSGQLADLPQGSLTFAPVLPAPYTLPVLLPGMVATLSASSSGFKLQVVFGSLQLTTLAVGARVYPGPVTLAAGQSVDWV